MIVEIDDNVISESSPVIGRRKEDIFTTNNNQISVEKRSPQSNLKHLKNKRQFPHDLPRQSKTLNENEQALRQKYSNKTLKSSDIDWENKYINKF